MSSTENMYSEWGIGQWTGYDDGFNAAKKGKNGGKINTKGQKKYLRTGKRKRISANKFKLNATIYTNIQ